MAMSNLLKKDMKEKRELINISLDCFLPRKDEYPKEIHKAMRHTLFAGGKRFRPYLTICVFNLFSDDTDKVKPIASAIELLHTYTLIHDDLPEIDNDEFRRGKKTCHVLFGSDIALLAGDALLMESFNMINCSPLENELKVKLMHEFAVAVGDTGIIAGQMLDILSEGKDIDKKTLEFIHKNKTGKLINICTKFGAYVAGASKDDVNNMEEFGTKLGLAFQITDDILDVEGTSAKLGKTAGKDEKVKKATYPAVYGIEKSKEMADKLIADAKNLLKPYGNKANILIDLVDFIHTRES